ncbi:VOC family protein [Hymenobacter sp. GOD-10R]|uniref:VOC family protein n=1 Tax=Hymenobacter sp. GOD-10R TaxID=3093922 RepID=UPI002D79F2AC|nr:VOC family protein [Hymenobacter sp. GOD-10R]WRQ30533.1 VOC family protein [Hymenobacter sp. GOD-10R]
MIEMPEKKAQGINGKMRAAHIGLRTTDYEGTIQWYTEKLGFRTLKKWTVGDLQLAFLAPANDDNFWIEVLSSATASTQQDLSQSIISGFQHFCLEVENVEETLAVLRDRGVKVLREPFDVPLIGKRCGFVADLHGNVIEFAANI